MSARASNAKGSIFSEELMDFSCCLACGVLEMNRGGAMVCISRL